MFRIFYVVLIIAQIIFNVNAYLQKILFYVNRKLCRHHLKQTPLANKWLPSICGALGGLLGVAAMYINVPDFPATDPLTALAVGIVSGLAATGADQVIKQIGKDN